MEHIAQIVVVKGKGDFMDISIRMDQNAVVVEKIIGALDVMYGPVRIVEILSVLVHKNIKYHLRRSRALPALWDTSL